jgi:hypothetical protein
LHRDRSIDASLRGKDVGREERHAGEKKDVAGQNR